MHDERPRMPPAETCHCGRFRFAFGRDGLLITTIIPLGEIDLGKPADRPLADWPPLREWPKILWCLFFGER